MEEIRKENSPEMQSLIIHNLGPVKDCCVDIKDFMVFTGEQASGKSTVAKSIFFFKNIPFLLNAEITKGRNVMSSDVLKLPLRDVLIKAIRMNFLRTFGTSWSMNSDMYMTYTYKSGITIKVSLTPDDRSPNYIWIDLSTDLTRFLKDLEQLDMENISLDQIQLFFGSFSEVIYIPAGRSMLTLLSDQLGYIYASMDDVQKRSLDYCMQNYLEMILKFKPFFSKDLKTLIDETFSLTSIKLDRSLLNHAQKLISEILQGEYKNVNGEERLFLSDGHYVKINFASSGQQEAVWILNLLFYFLLNKKNAYFIIEEPEAHLYPNVQKLITEFIALVKSDQNQVLVTTHSPYILGSLNNLLYAGEISEMVDKQELDKIIPCECRLYREQFTAYNMEDGRLKPCMDEDGKQIQSEVIDGASDAINEEYDQLVALRYGRE
ncbi:MAG: ATP-binding protein [Lachnospiraceae bacterium]|nr:ATP-binding protein [Lachnospiraceae bacterium]